MFVSLGVTSIKFIFAPRMKLAADTFVLSIVTVVTERGKATAEEAFTGIVHKLAQKFTYL